MRNKELNLCTNSLEKWERWTGSNRCPNCGSSEIEYNTYMMLASNPPQNQLRCKECGHIFGSGFKAELINSDALNKLYEQAKSILGIPEIRDPLPGEAPYIGDWPPSQAPNAPIYTPPSPNYGWICPKCGRCLAPHVDSCPHCNNTPTTINITY